MRRFSAAFLTLIYLATLTSIPNHVAAEDLADHRSVDGSGNNEAVPTWGSAGINLLRITPSDYADGLSAPAGDSRPSARAISNAVAWQEEEMSNNRDLTDFVWTWGQFIDHDIDLTDTGSEPFPIPVPTGDAFFDPQGTGEQEIGFTRSVFDPNTGTSNPREQINSITAFIDASNVYGSDDTRANALRTFEGGKLKTSDGDLLPFNTDGLPNAMSTSSNFFLAGDVRANEQPSLTALHTLFVREHNRRAEEIASENPDFTDDEIYWHARRFVEAHLQAITFEEFLPALFGNAIVPYEGYNPGVNPGIATIFSTAAYRFGHTMISSTILRLEDDGSESAVGPIALQQGFFNPSIIPESGGLASIMRGLAGKRMQEIDTREVNALRNFPFWASG